MDNLFGDDRTDPMGAADADYDQVMAKLNASLKRSASVRTSGMKGQRLGGRGIEGQPPLYEIDVDDYNTGDQLPSIEEARTTAASTLSRIERASLSGSRFPFDPEEEYEQQYNKFSRGPGGEAAHKRKMNWYKAAFFVVIASVLGIVIGLAVGFTVGEEVEKLEKEAQQGSGSGTVTTAPSPTSQQVPTYSPIDYVSVAPTVLVAQPNTAQPNTPPTSAPVDLVTPAPTFRHMRVHDVMAWLVSQDLAKQTDFTDATSYRLRAAHWIADQDAAKLAIPQAIGEGDAYKFIERYVMALFYVSTKGISWSYSFRFLSTESICSWNVDVTLPDARAIQIGVVCNTEGRVTSINIPQNNLVGSLVSELGLLTSLDFLALNHNKLDGSVPSEMAGLTKLSYLAVHYNTFDGPLPQWIGNFTSLRVLGMGDNKFTGEIPSNWSKLNNLVTLGLDNNLLNGDLSVLQGMTNLERVYLEANTFHQPLQAVPWAQLANLEELDLSGNSLSGTFPPEILGLTKLRVLDLGENGITGELPTFGELPSLQYLGLHSNKIGGSVPSSLANLINLTHLDLSENKFIGEIPHALGNLKTLKYLFIADNSELAVGRIPTFVGSLMDLTDLSFKGSNRVASIDPTLFADMKHLVLLELDNNVLTGEVPSEIGNLSSLTYLFLNNNMLTGTVPTEVQSLPQLDIFLVDRTDLQGDLNVMCTGNGQHIPEIAGADCFGDNPKIECSCCNICCGDGGMNARECRDRVYFGQLDPVWENSYQRRFYQFGDQDFGMADANTGDGSDIGHDDVLGNGSNVTKPSDDPALRRSRMLSRLWALMVGE